VERGQGKKQKNLKKKQQKGEKAEKKVYHRLTIPHKKSRAGAIHGRRARAQVLDRKKKEKEKKKKKKKKKSESFKLPLHMNARVILQLVNSRNLKLERSIQTLPWLPPLNVKDLQRPLYKRGHCSLFGGVRLRKK